MTNDIIEITTAHAGVTGGTGDGAAESGTIHLMICKGFSGEIVRAEVSPYDTVTQALPVIADQIGYYSPDWEKIGLYNLTRDFEYGMEERFIDAGTRPGDLLIMADGQGCHKE